MQIQFHGAARSVTGSQHLITINGKRLLLDCGFFQGKRDESYRRNLRLPYDARAVDAVVLSHAHIDHCGNLPNLVKSGFRGDVYCTHATRDLAALMLLDSGKIQEADVEYVNKQKRKRREPLVEPIYTMADARACMRHFVGLAYDHTREILPGVHLTLLDAGHILGSSIVVLDIEDREAKRDVRLVFSGDLGRPNRPILRDPAVVERTDLLIMESTYGDRNHKSDAASDAELRDVIVETMQRGGKVIVPAFAVGRTQELVYRIHRLVRDGEISARLPIYVDSPLAVDVTAVYRVHPEAFDAEAHNFMLYNQRKTDPFGFERLIYARSVEESKEINDLKGSAVIISASGMAEAGRILHHLKNNIEDERNTILIVGWTAPETLGRRIAEKSPSVRIFGEPYRLRARVATINGYSAHADRGELLAWAGGFVRPPARTWLVHGDETAALALADGLRAQGFPQVAVPNLHERAVFPAADSG